jgi:hypothetical protein
MKILLCTLKILQKTGKKIKEQSNKLHTYTGRSFQKHSTHYYNLKAIQNMCFVIMQEAYSTV